jgi:Fur family zinc uptake transcriptional regulator
MPLTTYLTQAQAKLRSVGGRITESRIEALSLIYKSKKPISALELIDLINNTANTSSPKKKIDRVTIFRMLNDFVELGLIHKVEDASAYIACAHFACSHHFHAVLKCNLCGAYQEVELPDKLFKDSKKFCSDQFNFELSDKHIMLDGVCGKCG